MKFLTTLRLPTKNMNYPFVQCILPISQLISRLSNELLKYYSACVQATLILFNTDPKVHEQ